MTESNTVEDWQIIFEDYTQRFGLSATPALCNLFTGIFSRRTGQRGALGAI